MWQPGWSAQRETRNLHRTDTPPPGLRAARRHSLSPEVLFLRLHRLPLPDRDEMGEHVERDSTIIDEVREEHCFRVLEDAIDLPLGELRSQRRKPASQIRFYHRPDAGKARRAPVGVGS